MSKKVEFIVIIIILTLLALGLLALLKNKQLVTKEIKIRDMVLQVDIADSPAEWYKGLSGRENLAENSGMLFIFPAPAVKKFVMREMSFPIDIIWIRDEQIVKIDENLPIDPSSPPKEYSSETPINYVLEVNANFSKINNIKVGDRIKYFEK